MGGLYGSKETGEAAVGALAVAGLMVERFKDGVQFSDFTAMWKAWSEDPVFQQKLTIAYKGYKFIPDEVSELDIDDLFDLLVVLLPEIKNLIQKLNTRPEGKLPDLPFKEVEVPKKKKK